MVYNTCLGQKIFTIGLPAECAECHPKCHHKCHPEFHPEFHPECHPDCHSDCQDQWKSYSYHLKSLEPKQSLSVVVLGGRQKLMFSQGQGL